MTLIKAENAFERYDDGEVSVAGLDRGVQAKLGRELRALYTLDSDEMPDRIAQALRRLEDQHFKKSFA